MWVSFRALPQMEDLSGTLPVWPIRLFAHTYRLIRRGKPQIGQLLAFAPLDFAPQTGGHRGLRPIRGCSGRAVSCRLRPPPSWFRETTEEPRTLATNHSVAGIEAAMVGVEIAHLGERVVTEAQADIPVFGLALVRLRKFFQIVEEIEDLPRRG